MQVDSLMLELDDIGSTWVHWCLEGFRDWSLVGISACKTHTPALGAIPSTPVVDTWKRNSPAPDLQYRYISPSLNSWDSLWALFLQKVATLGRLLSPPCFPGLCRRQLTFRYDGQLGSTSHKHRIEVRDGAGIDDVSPNGLGTNREGVRPTRSPC